MPVDQSRYGWVSRSRSPCRGSFADECSYSQGGQLVHNAAAELTAAQAALVNSVVIFGGEFQ